MKVLVIQTAFLGDLILTIPLLEVLSENGYAVHLIGLAQFKEIFEKHPAVKKYISFDKKGKDKGISGFLKILKEIKKENYDVLISPHRSTKTGLLAFLSGIKKKIGFDKGGARIFMDITVEYSKNSHEIERNLQLIEPLNLKKKNFDFFIPVEENIVKNLREELKDGFIVFSPGSNWKTKIWPFEYWKELAQRLSEKEKIVFVADKEYFKLKEDKNILNLMGKTNLEELIAIVKLSKMVVSGDSAIIHIASSFKKKTVEIYGPTIKEFGFYPYNTEYRIAEISKNILKCRPCSIHGPDRCPLGHFKCMKDLKVDFVLEKILNLL